MDFNGIKYDYAQDLQGDICQIVEASGNVVVEYTYDALAKVLSTTGSLASTLGTVQSFRYRGYVYDVETGLYYLKSRYYNAPQNRFFNADSVLYNNVFVYCSNNPIMRDDPNGYYDILNDGIKWSKPLKKPYYDMMSSDEFLAYLNKMVDQKWKYDYSGDKYGMRKGYVDCVSVYRYAIQHYYNTKGYYYYLPSVKIKNGKRNVLDNAQELADRGVHDLQAYTGDESQLVPGMVLFTIDEDGKYKHVAYYIGDGMIIESNVTTNKYPSGVHKAKLTDYKFVACAYLNGVDYSAHDTTIE